MITHEVKYLPKGKSPDEMFVEHVRPGVQAASLSARPCFNGQLSMRIDDKDIKVNPAPFLKVVKAFRKGEDNYEVVAFRCNEHIKYIGETINDKGNALDLNFRFSGCRSTGTCSGNKDTEVPFNTPPFYFLIRIWLDRKERSIMTGFNILKYSHKVFPHGGDDYDGFCFGGSTDQITDSLMLEDLTIVLDLFTLYLMNGTNVDDSLGSGYGAFNKDPDSIVVKYKTVKDDPIRMLTIFDKEIRDKIKDFQVQLSSEDEMQEFIQASKENKAKLKSLGIG